MQKKRWRTELRSEKLINVPLKIQIKSNNLAFKVSNLYLTGDIHVTMFNEKNHQANRKEIYEIIVFGSRALMSLDYIFNVNSKKTSVSQFIKILKNYSKDTLDLRLFQTFSNIQQKIDSNTELTSFEKTFITKIFNL